MTTLTFSLSRAISRDWHAGDEVVVSALDHYSNVSSWQQAAHDKGAIVKQVRVDESNYSIDMTHLASLITDKTKLIAVTLASNTTGSLVDVAKVVEMAKKSRRQSVCGCGALCPSSLSGCTGARL